MRSLASDDPKPGPSRVNGEDAGHQPRYVLWSPHNPVTIEITAPVAQRVDQDNGGAHGGLLAVRVTIGHMTSDVNCHM